MAKQFKCHCGSEEFTVRKKWKRKYRVCSGCGNWWHWRPAGWYFDVGSVIVRSIAEFDDLQAKQEGCDDGTA